MIREISAMDARKNFGELLNQIKYCHDNILIKKAGKPIAALIDIDLFEKIKSMRIQFDQLTTELNQAYQVGEESLAENDIAEAFHSIQKS